MKLFLIVGFWFNWIVAYIQIFFTEILRLNHRGLRKKAVAKPLAASIESKEWMYSWLNLKQLFLCHSTVV